MELAPYPAYRAPAAAQQSARDRERTATLVAEAEGRLDTLALRFSESLDATERTRAARSRVRDLARKASQGGAR